MRYKVLTAVGTRCANHVTPLYPQKLAPTSPTGGGSSVGMVRSRTKATEFSLVYALQGLGKTTAVSTPLKNSKTIQQIQVHNMVRQIQSKT